MDSRPAPHAPSSSALTLARAALPPWLDRAEYPFEPKRFATPDGDLSYLDEGEGPVVLLVHGTPSWSFEFRRVVASLRASHRCIAVDHLGFGLSDKPADADLTPEAHAQRLGAFVEALELRDVTLVVHDFGGPIGLPLALEPSSRVRRVVVLNSWMWPNGDDPALRSLDRTLRGPIGRFLYMVLNVSPRFLLPSTFGVKSRLTRALHRHYLAPFGRRGDRHAPYALARALVGADAHYGSLWAARARLAERPLTLVWGMRDPALTSAHLARWTDAFPEARVVRVDDAGHFVAEERPEVVVDAIVG